MTMNADGSRTIRAVDLVSYAEASVQARIAEQQQTIEALRQEVHTLRLRLDNAQEDARTRRYAEAVADLFSRWSDGSEPPVTTRAIEAVVSAALALEHLDWDGDPNDQHDATVAAVIESARAYKHAAGTPPATSEEAR